MGQWPISAWLAMSESTENGLNKGDPAMDAAGFEPATSRV